MAMNLNPLLLEALRSRQGSTTDPALQTLLSGMDAGASGDALPSVQELLSQLESTNPTAGLIAKYLAARQVSESQSSSEEAIVVEGEAVYAAEVQSVAVEQFERLAQVVQRLGGQVKKLRAELDQLREVNDALAAALGACYLCWGKDAGCPVCHGTGRPGTAIPDKQLFARFVAPVLHTLQEQKEVNRNKSTNGQFNAFTQDMNVKKGGYNE
jgi:hypothetical protein